MNNIFKVLGIVQGVSSKTGKPYTMLHVIRPFVQGGSQIKQGNECMVQFLDGNCPSDISVGCEVEFLYNIGLSGRPQVTGVIKHIDNSVQSDKQHNK